ncbi:MAG: Rab family GTPase [Thermoplasmata archaeon]
MSISKTKKVLLKGISKNKLVDVNRNSRIIFEVFAEDESYRLETISSVLESDGWSREGDRLLLIIPKNALIQPHTIRAVHDTLRRIQYLLKTSGIDYETRILSEDKTEATGNIFKTKIGLVGDHEVGKTSLVRRYVLDQFDDRYIRTIGAKVSKKEVYLNFHEDKVVRVDMSIWDVIGERHLAESHMERYYNGVQGVLAVVDVTRRRTLASIEDWVSSVSKIAGDVPVHLLVNKVDLDDQFAMGQGEVADLSTRIRSPFMFTSAKTGKNVENAFLDLAKRIALKSARLSSETLDITS